MLAFMDTSGDLVACELLGWEEKMVKDSLMGMSVEKEVWVDDQGEEQEAVNSYRPVHNEKQAWDLVNRFKDKGKGFKLEYDKGLWFADFGYGTSGFVEGWETKEEAIVFGLGISEGIIRMLWTNDACGCEKEERKEVWEFNWKVAGMWSETSECLCKNCGRRWLLV